MFRTTLRSTKQAQKSTRQFITKRYASTEYGPEQQLLSRGTIITAVLTTGFIGAVWYDNFYAKRSKENKSAIGDWLIPSGPSREQVFSREDMMAAKALKRREEMQILFSQDNSRVNIEEPMKQNPVPEPLGRSVRPGQTMDLEKIDERRPRTVYFKKLDNEQSAEQKSE